MIKTKKNIMAANDSRQIMLRDNFEIYSKSGPPRGALEMHFHDFYELMYVESGGFPLLVDNKSYMITKGDFVLINKNHLHHYQYHIPETANSSRILLWISDRFLNSLSESETDLSACFLESDVAAWHFSSLQRTHLISCLNELLYLETDNTCSETERHLLQRSYLTIFFVQLNRLIAPSGSTPVLNEAALTPMLKTLSSYIDKHLGDNLTIDELSKVVHLSKFHLIHKFKELTGMTIHDYVTSKRIIHASELIGEGLPLGLIHERCGFSSYSSFFRNFKAIYGISPKEYRGNYQ